ncbi:hypothetical protein K9M59_02325 [Candidatus Gracilibacteria bacterium]|nr:hypothetical protein [Candidatus Gracilibacteria bacterium]MCF7819678.1 hypothetical protein [Candidatus Gracilibacteria bacterium]
MKKKTLAFSEWKEFVHQAFRFFPALWWRIGAVNVLTMLLIIVSSALLFAIAYIGFREQLQNFFVNVQFGGAISNGILLILFALVWGLFVLVFSINGKVANWLVIKNHLQKKKRNPFSLYFVDAWSFFWRYIGIGLRMIWHILWPIAFVLFATYLATSFWESRIIFSTGIVFGIFVGIWRFIEVFLAPPLLIAKDTDPKKIWEESLTLVRGRWWRVFLSFITFFFLLNIVRIVFFLPDFVLNFGWEFSQDNIADYLSNSPQMYEPTWLIFLDGFFSFLILPPLFIGFVYLLTLHLSGSKK